jgi:hypothetical protein
VPAQRKNPGGEAADDQAPRQQEIPPPFFSHPLAGGGTSFSFPARKESIGQWSIDGNGYKEVVAPFVVPPQHRLFFKAGAIFSEHPVFFGGFRADDLGGLSFHRALTWNSKHFAQVSRLKSLKEISFSGLLLKATDLECVDQLPALLHLAVSYTGLKGGALAKLACLGRLTNLEANNIEDITTLLVRLRNNTVLDHLSVKECGLTDSDMKIIGTMGGLRTLCIYDNPVTITGLRSIVGLNVLDTLRTDQEFGPQVIDIVGHFKHLLRLRVSTAGWSQADRQRLRQVLPGACTIEGL